MQSLPAAWVDEIFARLAVRYGSAFTRQWPDADISVVKGDWGSVLAGFDGDDIKHALAHLPADSPPNAMQFRALCLRAPVKEAPKLEGPKADPGRVKALLERMKTAHASPKRTADRLREIAKTQRLTQAQQQALTECEWVSDTTSIAGTFTPIPPELWPWNKGQAA